MRIGFGLNVEQTQKLIMTPELRQAIAILQLSSLELETYIQQQLQENPLLEISEVEEKDESVMGREELAVTREQDAAGDKTGDLDWQEYFQDSSDLGIVKIEKNHNEEEYSYENFVSREPTMQEHLHWQLNMTPCDGQLRCIISFLIGNLDGRGYLRISTSEAAAYLGVEPGRAEEALAVLQTFDPPGIGARNLVECLLIQLRQRGQEQGLAGQIVRHYLDDLARGKLMRIAGQLDVPVQEVQRAVDLIRSLEPKPGRNFPSNGDVRYVVPDVVLEKVGGDYI
ncbi:MAG: RNA polymerase sigma-54 factor, partial [Bacillota bacterium]